MNDYLLYKQGANVAWELAKKIFNVEKDGGFTSEELIDIFGTASVYEIMNNNNGILAIYKAKESKRRNKK